MASTTSVTCNTKITYEEFRDGKVLRNYLKVAGTNFGNYYTKAVLEEQVNLNDDQETVFYDEQGMDPYEVYNSKKFLCHGGSGPCSDSFAGELGNLFKSTGTWKSTCPVFHT